MSSAIETIGMILKEPADRDAIHVATLAVVALVKLNPGDHVGVHGDKNNPIGIVDPFLKAPVKPGERFWLCVYPRTVTSLRHVWGHPKVPHDMYSSIVFDYKKQDDKVMSKEWIKDYADSIGLSYSELIQGTEDYILYDYALCRGSLLDGVALDPEFWVHYETVTHTKVDNDRKGNFFSCAC